MVFVRSEDKVDPGFDVRTILSRKATAGDIGLEIEVEGNKFPKPVPGAHTPVPLESPGAYSCPGWSYVHDGSLRGKDNAEYVLTKPINFDEVPSKVEALFDCLKKYGSVITESNRTSVHVHLNCQTFHFNRLTSFLALYFSMEEVLAEWCGEHRVGNLFCLRAKDAPAIVSSLRRFIRSNGKAELRDNLHYAGMNANALVKFGSLECRLLRGCDNAKTIIDWCSILQRLYDLSADYSDPRDIMDLFSMSGPNQFFETVLGPVEQIVRDGISMNNDQIAESMLEGIRLAQSLCYCRDWTKFKEMNLKPDPFGRKASSVMKKVLGAMGGPAPQPVGLGGTVSPHIPQVYATEETLEMPDFDPEYD